MSQTDSLADVLTAHFALCQQALELAQQENSALSDRLTPPALQSNETKKQLISSLTDSLDRLRKARFARQTAAAQDFLRDDRLTSLIRANQDLMLRVLVLSRESERLFLERGLFAPRDLPSANHQRPHFVADLYRRQGAGA